MSILKLDFPGMYIVAHPGSLVTYPKMSDAVTKAKLENMRASGRSGFVVYELVERYRVDPPPGGRMA